MMKILIKLPALGIAGAIWFLSAQSVLPSVKGVFGFDKFQHLFAYMVLAGMIGLWISPKYWKTRSLLMVLLVMGIASAYGVIDEIHQSFVPGRDCNVWDWLADTLGAGLGAGILLGINRRRSPSEV